MYARTHTARLRSILTAFALPLALAILADAPTRAATVAVEATASPTLRHADSSLGHVGQASRAHSARGARREVRRAKRAARRAARLAMRAPEEPSVPNGMAVAGFVCAVAFFYLGPVGSILGIVFGAIGLRRNSLYPELYGRRKMAKAALIIGIVGLALTAVYIAAIAAFLV